MTDLLPSWPLFCAFLAAGFVLAVTPGPGVLYIVTRSLKQGRAAGLASVAGVALGNLGNALGASLGLAALFALSSLAFMAVKYCGAAYLFYLGYKALRAPSARVTEAILEVTPLRRIFADGFVVALLNPKTALFFAAFLPQFVAGSSMPLFSTMLLGAIFVALAATTDCCYALCAGSARRWLGRRPAAGAIGRYLGGSVYIGLGLLAACASPRAGR